MVGFKSKLELQEFAGRSIYIVKELIIEAL